MPFGSDEMVTRARAWLDANAAQFRVPLDAGPQPFVRGVKMVAERAQLGDLLGFAPWIDDGWRELGEGAHLVHAMTLHPGLALMAPAYVPFHRRGHASAAVLDFVRATAARIADFPPPRRFYIAWAAEALELPCETSFEAAVHDTALEYAHWMRNQLPRTSQAGSRTGMKKKNGTRLVTFARGYMTM